jgi:multidrug efflux pump subunit AcrB
VESAVRLRLRPILMSTMTSIFGMLPLMLLPGSGSELYRGMASVIVGGMLVSTVFTLILLPSLLRMNEEKSALVHASPETV